MHDLQNTLNPPSHILNNTGMDLEMNHRLAIAQHHIHGATYNESMLDLHFNPAIQQVLKYST